MLLWAMFAVLAGGDDSTPAAEDSHPSVSQQQRPKEIHTSLPPANEVPSPLPDVALPATATRRIAPPIPAVPEPTASGSFDGVPYAGTLRLPSTPLPPPKMADPAAECPTKYVFVNTHTFGRHHNQLQEFLNIAVWAKRFGRTAILGWFRHNHKWMDPSELYDLSDIMQHYCLITPAEFQKRNGGAKVDAICFGQGIADTPLKRYGKIKCSMSKDVGAHYNVRHGMNITEGFLPKLLEAKETMMVLSGEIGFFLRCGLESYAAIYSLLQPAKEIADEVEAFLRRALWDDSHGGPKPYFGLHLRQREKDCLKEVYESFEDGVMDLASVNADERTVIKTQCAMTVAHVAALQQSLGFVPKGNTLDGAMFLASDHENMVLENSLVAAGAIMYKGGKFHTKELGGMKGLAVDFFVLTRGKYFTGNQLSSVSQNVCYIRLGRGEACHGFVPSFSEYHARSLDSKMRKRLFL